MFNHGKLHNSPLILVDDNKLGYSWSKMQNGRAAYGCYWTAFNKNFIDKPYYLDSLGMET